MQGTGKRIIFLTGILWCVFLTACSGNGFGENTTKSEKIGADTFQMENSMDSFREMPDGEEENMEQEIMTGSYAIQNTGTGKNIRPRNASTQDEAEVILYRHAKWKCMTWNFVHVEDNVYQLENLYTHKTFEPSEEPVSGAALWQQPIQEKDSQYWEFISLSDGIYLIRLKGTKLYVTISSEKGNSPIILMPREEGSNQEWTLIEQYPKY